jgi:hypothetical protein
VLAARLKRPTAPAEAERPRWFDGAALGMRLLWTDHVIRRTMLVVVTGVVATSAIDVALVYLVRDYLDAGELGYGIMLGLWGVGMMAGSVFASRSVKPKREYAWLVGGIAVIGLAILGPRSCRRSSSLPRLHSWVAWPTRCSTSPVVHSSISVSTRSTTGASARHASR